MSASEYARYRRELANFKLAKADDEDQTKAGANRAGHISFPTRAQPSTPAFLQRFIKYIPDETIFAYERVINIIGNGLTPSIAGHFTVNPSTTRAIPSAGAIDSAGNIYWADKGGSGTSTVRVLNASTNTITNLIAPGQSIGGSQLNSPRGLTRDSAGNMAITDSANNRLLYYSVVSTRTLYGVTCAENAWTVILTGGTDVNTPQQLSFAPNGDIYWADFSSGSIKRIRKSGGEVAEIMTEIIQPRTVYVDSAGNIFILRSSGRIYMLPVIAGRYFGKDIPALATLPASGGSVNTETQWDILYFGQSIFGIVTDSFGNLYFNNQTTKAVNRIDFKTGAVTVVAGNGSSGFQGGSVPVASATFGNGAAGLFMDSADNLYVCDGGGSNYSIRKIPYENKLVRPARWE